MGCVLSVEDAGFFVGWALPTTTPQHLSPPSKAVSIVSRLPAVLEPTGFDHTLINVPHDQETLYINNNYS